MNKVYKVLISVLSVLLIISFMPFSNVAAETPDTSKDLDTLVSELMYYYGEDARTDVLRTLEEIEERSMEDYELWNSVINQWDWIENNMHENLTVAPDGLPNDDKHVFIVLGFALTDEGEMEDELIGRLEVALNSAEKYPNSYVLVTGGVEKNGWTEGDRMHDWLVENGLSEDRIIVENESSKTVENAAFSYDILYNDYDVETVSLITSQYHLKRGSIFYYTMSLLKAKEFDKEPLKFLGEGNAGWYRSDKTEEPMSLKARGMSQIAGVEVAEDLPISELEELIIEGDLVYDLDEKLNLKIYAKYDNDYVRDVTELADITELDLSEPGDSEVEINYEENGITLNENITIRVLDENEEWIDKDNPHYDNVMKLYKKGVIRGYSDGGFGTWDSVTRGQVAVMLTKALGLEIPHDIDNVLETYSDVRSGDRYAEEIAAVTAAGIFKGKEDGTFNRYSNISRQQIATVLVEGFNLKDYDDGEDVEINLDKVSASHVENVKTVANLGITNQTEDFRAYEDLSRAAFSTFLVKSMEVPGK